MERTAQIPLKIKAALGSCLVLMGMLTAFNGAHATSINDIALQAQPEREKQVEQNGIQMTLSPIPSWVTPASVAPKTSTDSFGGHVRYHLFDQQSYVADEPHHFYRLVKQANNVSGLEAASKLQISFNPAFQKLHVHTANVIRNGKLVYSLKADDIKLFSNEDELQKEMLSGRVSALVLLPGTRTGDVIDMQYSLMGANPIFGKRYSSSFDLGWSVPLDQGRVRVVIPKHRSVNYKTMGIELSPTENKGPEQTELIWSLQNPTPIFDEEQYPFGYVRFPYVSVSEYENWAEVIEQQVPFYDDRTLPKDLIELVDQTLAGLSKEQQVMAALKIAQQEVRYLGLEYGINAFKPHSPTTVWNNRRGDCKDKTLLLISILQRVGIDAYPALVNTQYREGLINSIAAPNRFDHVITQVVIDDQSYWLDPTNSPQTGTLGNIAYHSFDQALVLKKGGTSLTAMPLDSTDNNRTQVIEEITISDYTAPVQVRVTSVYQGKSAERLKSSFENNHLEKIQREYIQYYEKQFGHVLQWEPLSYHYDAVENRFEINEFYVIDNFFKKKQDGINFSLAATAIKDYLNIPKAQKRNTPFYLGRPKYIQHQVKVHFPKEEIWNNPDFMTVVSNDYFDFRFDNIILPNTYLLNFELAIKDWIVKGEDANQVIEDLNQTNQTIYRSFSYQPDSAYVDELVGGLIRKHNPSAVGRSVK